MDLIALIHKAIDDSHTQEARRYIGASSIGNPCIRSIWYEYNGIIGDKIDSKTQITFDIGRNIEGLLLDYLEMAGLKIIRPSDDNKHLYFEDSKISEFQGHADAILDLGDRKIIVEIKTAKSSSFATFKKDGLHKWSPSYYAQVQSYLGMSGLFEGVLIAINKDTSEIHTEWVSFSEDDYLSLCGKASYIKSFEEPPARINNNSCFYICQRCRFRSICHYEE